MSDAKVGVILPKGNNVYGAWITLAKDCDVHIDIENRAFVLGHNTPDLYHGKVGFTPLALILDKNGASLQYAGKDNEYVNRPVDAGKVGEILLKALQEIKELPSKPFALKRRSDDDISLV